jgi:branched-chain amino acid aminotransferase
VPTTIYLNGQIVKPEDAKISVFDHGFLYGDGVFEGIRCYKGVIFRLDAHLDRLYDSAKSIWLEIPISKQEMKDAHIMTMARSGLRDAYIRTIVSRGTGDLSLEPRTCKPNIVIIADTISLFPPELYDNGIKVITSSYRRTSVDALNARTKPLNYLNNIHAKMQAIQAGVPEALMLNSEGYVAEGTGENIFIVKDGTVITPPKSAGILAGITRKAVLEIAKEAGYACSEENITLHDVYTADEAFLTGTAAEVVPVIEADLRKIGTGKPGPATKTIMTGFHKLTETDGAKVDYASR